MSLCDDELKMIMPVAGTGDSVAEEELEQTVKKFV